MMGGLDGAAILRSSLAVAPNVAYFLPRNVDTAQVRMPLPPARPTCAPGAHAPPTAQVRALAAEAGTAALELERTFLNRHEKALTAYFGFEEEEEEEEGWEEEAEEEAAAEDEPLEGHASRGEANGIGAGLAADDPLFD